MEKLSSGAGAEVLTKVALLTRGGSWKLKLLCSVTVPVVERRGLAVIALTPARDQKEVVAAQGKAGVTREDIDCSAIGCCQRSYSLADSPFDVEWSDLKSISAAKRFHCRLTREFLTSTLQYRLRLK